MGKVVKLKLSDIENIVKKTISENSVNEDELNMDDAHTTDHEKGESGRIRYYITDVNTGEVVPVK